MKRSSIVILIGLMAFSVSCREDSPVAEIKNKVKFDIQGSFSGKLLIVYTNTTGGNNTLNDVSIPWSLEQTFSGALSPVGIGAQASVLGKAGETATLKIFVNGKEVKSSSATAGSLGEIVIPTIAY